MFFCKYVFITCYFCLLAFPFFANESFANESLADKNFSGKSISDPSSMNDVNNINSNFTSLTLSQILKLAKEKNLAKSSQWLRLLHYNRGGTLHSRNKSYAGSSNFFLSESGSTDPEAELKSNIDFFYSKDINKRCDFPARFHWLTDQLEIPNYLEGLSHCSQFLKIQQQVAAKQITLIFPSAYLNSASSIFGHTLLRIDNSEDDDAVILNWAINYGAKLEKDDGAIKYAIKGVAGLYKGQYFIVPYSQKIKEYGQIENRDIWEYPLSLSQAEVTFLTEHLWELRDINFDYFFFDENCSYRLLELLEVAKPDLDLSSRFRLTEIPVNTVKILHDNNLIKETVFRPSKERLLKRGFSQLNAQQKTLSKRLSDDISQVDMSSFKSLNSNQKIAVLKTAYDYLRFQQSQESRNPDSAKRSLELLKLINSISLTHDNNNSIINHEPSLAFENDGDILASHDSHRVKTNVGKFVEGGAFQSIQYRMAYHDLLDNSEGFFKGAHIQGPSITIKHFNQTGDRALTKSETFIDELTLLNIMSLNPRSDTRKELSWELGIQSLRTKENNKHLNTIIKGGGGYSWDIRKNFLTYQLLSPRVEISPNFDNSLNAGMEFKFGLLRNSGKHPSLLELKAIKLDSEEIKYLANFSQQFELHRNHALRAEFTYFEQENNQDAIQQTIEMKSFALSYLYYF
jgi:hypothetical protein